MKLGTIVKWLSGTKKQGARPKECLQLNTVGASENLL